MAASSACLIGNGLSTRSNRTTLSKNFNRSYLFSSWRISSLNKAPNSKPATIKASSSSSLDQSNHEGRRGFLKFLAGNVGAGLPALLGSGKAYADEQQGVSSSRMSYSRFLEYLDKDRVSRVDLYENGTIAIVEAVSPELGNRVQRVRVQLPGLNQELLQKFREKNIDFAAHNAQDTSPRLGPISENIGI
ncbi:ATP-dependent zinc metalloprotease FTSH 8, chloroplastic-like [Arachis ipaensis]|uniref:ATP-dependent zinc metalloprotease FTSH 8, chloroplastic-like n=1 Tax=Arachis ipaensis TaxID=130454 RepID=UPI0007AF0819|nr:ATP-dependent zinc metalloprotease FTSH 8, chloroplastic-like [Arachis ipaensis]